MRFPARTAEARAGTNTIVEIGGRSHKVDSSLNVRPLNQAGHTPSGVTRLQCVEC
jgi:hypothetical protein